MNKQIQWEFQHSEMNFPIEFNTITVILRINGFATIFIVGFDPTIAEVGDVVGVIK
jgi:hypothetical protein